VIPRVSAVEGIKVPDSKELAKLRDKGVDIFKHLGVKVNNHRLPEVREVFPDINEIKVFEWKSDVEYGLAFPDGFKDVEIQRMIHFFESLDVKGVSDKIITDLYEKGFETISSVLNITIDQMAQWDGYGKSRATLIMNELTAKVEAAAIENIMHGSNCFNQLGSTKIAWARNLNKEIFPDGEVALRKFDLELRKIDGYGEELIIQYISGRKKFSEWTMAQGLEELVSKKMKSVPQQEKAAAKDGELSGQKFCFTKVRDKALEQIIADRGGLVTEDLSKSVTTLVVKDHGTASSKKDKAQKWGIRVIDISELRTILGKDEKQSSNAIF